MKTFFWFVVLLTFFAGNTIVYGQSNEAEAFNLRGISYHQAGEFDRAIVQFNQAIMLEPAWVAPYFNRGAAYIEKGDFNRAITDMTQAIRLAPDIPIFYAERAFAYAQIGDFDRAIADLELASRLEPDNANHRRGLEVMRQRQQAQGR